MAVLGAWKALTCWESPMLRSPCPLPGLQKGLWASEHPPWSGPGLLKLRATDILDQVTLCCALTVFTQNPGLSPLDARGSPPV